MPKLENPKRQILDTTRELLQERSFNSISFNDISTILGIKKASIYYHFNSKSILAVEVLKQYRENIKKLIDSLNDHTTDPWKRLQGYFRYFFNLQKTGNRICPGAVMSAEYNTLEKEIQNELRVFFLDHFEWLIDVLQTGRDQGKFAFDGDPKDKALFIESLVHGGMLLSRLLEKPDEFKKLVNQIKRDLGVEER